MAITAHGRNYCMLDINDIIVGILSMALGWHEVRMNVLDKKIENQVKDAKEDLREDLLRVEAKLDGIMTYLVQLKLQDFNNGQETKK